METRTEKNQEIFETLSALEEFFFYKKNNPEELEPFRHNLFEMHQEIKTLVCQWHNLTGCKNP